MKFPAALLTISALLFTACDDGTSTSSPMDPVSQKLVGKWGGIDMYTHGDTVEKCSDIMVLSGGRYSRILTPIEVTIKGTALPGSQIDQYIKATNGIDTTMGNWKALDDKLFYFSVDGEDYDDTASYVLENEKLTVTFPYFGTRSYTRQ